MQANVRFVALDVRSQRHERNWTCGHALRCEDVQTHVSVGIRPHFRLTRNRVWDVHVAFLRTCARASIRRKVPCSFACTPRATPVPSARVFHPRVRRRGSSFSRILRRTCVSAFVLDACDRVSIRRMRRACDASHVGGFVPRCDQGKPRKTQPRESTAPVSPPDTPHPQTHPSWSLRPRGVEGRVCLGRWKRGVHENVPWTQPSWWWWWWWRRWRTSAPSYVPSWKSCVPTEREGRTSWPTIENACRKKKKNMAWCGEKVQGSDDTHHPHDKKNVKRCKTRRTR